MEASLISAHSVFVIGDGKRVWFWEDCLRGSTHLYSTFPSLYNLAAFKGGMVAYFLSQNGELGG